MIDEQGKGIHYDDSQFRALIGEYKTLSTFAEVALWDQRAQDEINKIAIVFRAVDDEIAKQNTEIELINKAILEKPFFARIFSNRRAEDKITQQIQKYCELKALLEELATRLQENIDFTPNSPEEQKNLLKELRQRKKELLIEKREVAAAMKDIRVNARQQSVQAGKAFGIIYNSTLAASERRGIRYDRENALRPKENYKASIERKINQVERDILWVERFRE